MAATRNRLVVKSNFKAAKAAGDDAIAELIAKASEEMEKVALQRLERANQARGYNISTEHLQEDHSRTDGRIRFTEFYGPFFEFGTVRIAAMPFIRPGHRAGRKVVKDDARGIFEKWMNRKARIRT